MQIDLGDVTLNAELHGPDEGAPLVLIHTFGTDLSLWDAVLPLLPTTLRVLRFDLRGHGRSSCPPAPYSMGALVRDAERLLDHLSIRDAMVLGLGLGGLIAQGLAVKRLDQVRALGLVNTAVRLGHAPHWRAMMDELASAGAAPLAARMMPLWFHRADLRAGAHQRAEAQFAATPVDGLIGAFAAIKGTDFYTPTSGLRLPTLAMSGAEDRLVPPDMLRETAALIPGSEFHLLRRSSHLSPLDQPAAFAKALSNFLIAIGQAARAAKTDDGAAGCCG
ncbi:alpha/beta fold hydrolase [Cognatishimia sp. SS12]|uniref:alpha/beta fold hydrolase n=1 Tax=Cognatishimia sp. SS12 TaxID=2979465 RepID=UPI0023305F91|nr:alpha/beta fold hydrolase [Cognatishimia sp. SS12]MDC0738766.1 alpha/beta fold hydrolase [Cognatishimia sp. SS12]